MQYFIFILLGLAGVAISFYIFGIELALYFTVCIVGLIMSLYSKNSLVAFIGGWVWRAAMIIILVTLIYYTVNKMFFPSDPFKFQFLGIAIFYTAGVLNNVSKYIGELVLSLINMIFP